MSIRGYLAIVWLGMSAALAPDPAAARPRVTPAAMLAGRCEAFMAAVLASEDPASLPVRVLSDPPPKIGPYAVVSGDREVGGVKVDTVLTGWMEYQDGPARARTPFFCLGRGKKVGYYYACQHSASAPDRPVLPVRECRARHGDDPSRVVECLAEQLARSEALLASSMDAARTVAERAGPWQADTFRRAEREFVAYRTHSCDVFRAPDASTDAGEFLLGCLVRLNTTRARALAVRATR